jgi:hypothetical protein
MTLIKQLIGAFAAFGVALILTPQSAFAQQYESYGVREAKDILPPAMQKGAHFRVHNDVVSYDYLHHYTVESDFGTFKVSGDSALRKLMREIAAIAALKETKTREAVGESVKQAAKSPFQLAKNLVTSPVDTISGVPEGVYQIVGNVSESVTMTHDPSEDAQIKQALFVSSWKRDFAANHNVDVYSSNKVLQKELNRVGWAAAISGLSISVATIGADTAVKVLKNLRLANQINNALKEEPPSRLRLINEEKLQKMAVPQPLIDRFLDHPSFSPRHDTIITECLFQMEGTRGRDNFIQYIVSAQDEVGANFFQQMAETMRGYHEMVSPLVEISSVAGLIVAHTKNGSALIPFPLDHGVWRARAAGIFNQIKAEYRPANFNGTFDLWVAGTVSALAREQLAARGVTVTENVDESIGFMD